MILDELCTNDMSASVFGPELQRYLERNYPGMAVQAWGGPAGESLYGPSPSSSAEKER